MRFIVGGAMDKSTFFSTLWASYAAITPQAERIQHLLMPSQTVPVVHDHVALRTFDIEPLNIATLEPLMLSLGYVCLEHYVFPEKHLQARAYLGVGVDDPKIFLSELETQSLTFENQHIVRHFCAQIVPEEVATVALFTRGRVWQMPTWAQYQSLRAESEYAAWLSVMGLCANHFALSVDRLSPPRSLEQVNAKVKSAGFVLNTQGGEIKGRPADLLEQSSTLADQTSVTFADGDAHAIATCYYEFARRYEDVNGQVFHGFLAANANTIFESTEQTQEALHA